MKPKIREHSVTQMVLSNYSVQLLILIILSIFVGEAFIVALSYFRFYFPTWLDDVIFNPVVLVFFLSPFTGSETSLSFVIFNPTLFAILLLPIVYLFLFRPWVMRMAERKRADEMRIEKERIEYARKVKNEFLTNLNHEMRTHLNSIIGFSGLLKAMELNEKQEHYVSNILKSGNLQLAIISDLLDLNKVETGKMELAVERIHVPGVIEEAVAPLKEKAEKQKIALKKEFDPDLEFMEADRYIFKEVLSNLLSNAVKFSKDEGGIVTVTTKKEGDVARISVSDTGIGITEEDMERVFNQFPHIDSGESRRYEGTGLGLALSKQLVELHGGRIWAESKLGEGSTFTFLLPLKAEKKVENK
jgi:signal transduction histidine kinase